jgi:hypothetical protein
VEVIAMMGRQSGGQEKLFYSFNLEIICFAVSTDTLT